MAIITGIVPSPDQPGHVVLLVDGVPFTTIPAKQAETLGLREGASAAESGASAPIDGATRTTYERALSLLSFRDRSVKELQKRLLEKGEAEDKARSRRQIEEVRPSQADPATTTPPAPSCPRAVDGKTTPPKPPNLAHVVLAAHLRPRDVGPGPSRCHSCKIEAGTPRPRERRRKRRQPEVRQDGHDHLAGRDVSHNRPPPIARAGQNVQQIEPSRSRSRR